MQLCLNQQRCFKNSSVLFPVPDGRKIAQPQFAAFVRPQGGQKWQNDAIFRRNFSTPQGGLAPPTFYVHPPTNLSW